MNKLAFGAAFAALAFAVPAAAPAQRNNNAAILIVDTSRVLSECTACVAANNQIQTQVTSLQQRQQQIQQQLQTEGQPIQTAVNALNGRQPDAALTSRIRAFETRQTQLAQELQGRSQQIQSIQAHVNQQLGTRLIPILEQVRATRRAAIILSKGSTLANDPALDVTNDVLTQLNQQLPSVSVTPMPQAQQPAAQQPPGR